MTGILSATIFQSLGNIFIITVLVVLFFLLTLLFAISRNPDYNTNWLSGIIAGFILLIAGFINMNMHFQTGNILKGLGGYKGTAFMEVLEAPVQTRKSVKTIVQVRSLKIDGTWQKHHQKILAYFEKDSCSERLVPGAFLVSAADFRVISPPRNPEEFDYRKYLAARSVYNQVYIASGSWNVAGNDQRSIRAVAFHMQQQLLNEYKKIGLNNTLYSILSALTLGYKSDLEAHTKHIFSQAGVMHVMALSGFNVAVIAFAMSYLLSFIDRFRNGRIFKTTVIITVIWLFAFVTGLSPSVTRAAVMIMLVMIGALIQRRVNTMNILLASAFILLAISPALITDISFQLSFTAVFGIIVFHPPLYRLVSFKNSIIDKIWQIFTVSCAAQIATLPFTLFYFHQFPVYFWLTNLYVVPLVSVIICVAGIFLIVSFINPLMNLVGELLSLLLEILYRAVSFTEILPFAVIENIRVDKLQLSLLIMLLLIIALYLAKRQFIFVLTAMVIFVVLQLVSIFKSAALNNQQILMVGNCKGISALNMISGRNSILFCDKKMSSDDPILQYAFRNFWIKHGVTRNIQIATFKDSLEYNATRFGENKIFNFSGRQIMIFNDSGILKWKPDNLLKLDVLIITGSIEPDLDGLNALFEAEMLIVDSSVKSYKAEKWFNLCTDRGMDCWIVEKQGAYVLAIR